MLHARYKLDLVINLVSYKLYGNATADFVIRPLRNAVAG